MAQQREKDETLDLKVPTDTPLTCILTLPDPIRPDSVPAKPRSDRTEEASPSPTSALNQRRRPDRTAVKKWVNRCSGCGKRVGLTGFRCRCGDLFCSEHRYSDRHDCSYDYKAVGRQAIARENPLVRPAKILKV